MGDYDNYDCVSMELDEPDDDNDYLSYDSEEEEEEYVEYDPLGRMTADDAAMMLAIFDSIFFEFLREKSRRVERDS